MADETREATGGDQAAATESGAQADTDLVTDLSKVDPRLLQSEIDRAVQRAIKSREETLTKKQQEERAAQERTAAEERGEYERIKAEMAAERDRLRQEIVLKDTMVALREVARDAGLVDMDDLALLRGEAVAEAVDENGAVDDSKLKELVERFRADKPHKFKTPEAGESRRASRLAAPQPPQTSPSATAPKGPDHYKNEGLDAYAEQRDAAFKRFTTWGNHGDTAVDALAKALRSRLKE